MLHQIQTAESSLITVIRQATAELANVGGADLAAALADLERTAAEAKARLNAAADRARGLFFSLSSEVGPLGAQLAADLFAPAPAQQQAETPPVAAAPAAAQDATQPEADPAVAVEAPRPASDAPAAPAEPVVTIAANAPVEAPARKPRTRRQPSAVVAPVEATAQIVEALRGQAGDGASREDVEAGLEALALGDWHKGDLLALARRLHRDTTGKPGKAELVAAVRAAVLDVQAVTSFAH